MTGKSPSKKPSPSMPFGMAMGHVAAGKKVARKEWGNNGEYGHMSGGWLMIHRPDGKDYQWQVAEADMVANDWITV